VRVRAALAKHAAEKKTGTDIAKFRFGASQSRADYRLPGGDAHFTKWPTTRPASFRHDGVRGKTLGSLPAAVGLLPLRAIQAAQQELPELLFLFPMVFISFLF